MNRILKIFLCLIIFSLLFHEQVFAKTVSKTQYIIMNKQLLLQNNNINNDIKIEHLYFTTELSDYSSLIDENVNEKILSDTKGYRYDYKSLFLTENESNSVDYTTSLKLSMVNYELNPSKVSSDYSKIDDNIKQYLLPSYKIESDNPLIISKAQQINNNIEPKNRNNPYYITKGIFNYIQTNMRYSLDKSQSNKGALFAEKYLVGVCEDYADYMVALLRANKIPARTVYGFRFSASEIQNTPKNLETAHMWVEVYFNNYGWVFFDPTMSQNHMEEISFTNDDGENITIPVYSALSFPNESTFGRMTNGYYYAKLQYDFGNKRDRISSTQSIVSSSLKYNIQRTNNPYLEQFKSITLEKAHTITPNHVYFKVTGTTDNNEKIEIDNSLIDWKFSNNSIANMPYKGILALKKINGTIRVNATFDGLTSNMNLTVKGF